MMSSFYNSFWRARSDGGSGVKKIKTISQKVFNKREVVHTHTYTHTVSAILLNTQTNLFSQTHTHTHFSETADVSTGNS